MDKNLKKMPYIKYGLAIILTTVGIVAFTLYVLKINEQPLLLLIIQSFIK